jgi:hypothetical protein
MGNRLEAFSDSVIGHYHDHGAGAESAALTAKKCETTWLRRMTNCALINCL